MACVCESESDIDVPQWACNDYEHYAQRCWEERTENGNKAEAPLRRHPAPQLRNAASMLFRYPKRTTEASRCRSYARSESSLAHVCINLFLRIPYPTQGIQENKSKNPAPRLFDLLASRTTAGRAPRSLVAFPPLDLVFAADGRVDGQLEDVVDALHLFTTALHVHGAHAFRHGLALFRRDGSETLRFQEVDAGSFRAEIGFEPDEDQRGGGAEVEHFRVPLWKGSVWYVRDEAW